MHDFFDRIVLVTEYGELLKNLFTLIAICTVRMYAAMQIMPITTEQAIQGLGRNALALCFGAYVAWGQPLEAYAHLSSPVLVALMLKEIVIGLCIGYAVSSVFWVAESVGVLIDNQAGFNNVQQSNPLSGEQSTPIGNLLSQLAIAGFYMLGGLVALFGVMFESFRWWPVAQVGPAWHEMVLAFLDQRTSGYLQLVVKLAMPVVFVLCLIDLGIGLVAKTADKLEPNNLAQPIKGAVALFMLALLVALFFQQVRPELGIRDIAALLDAWMSRRPAGH